MSSVTEKRVEVDPVILGKSEFHQQVSFKTVLAIAAESRYGVPLSQVLIGTEKGDLVIQDAEMNEVSCRSFNLAAVREFIDRTFKDHSADYGNVSVKAYEGPFFIGISSSHYQD